MTATRSPNFKYTSKDRKRRKGGERPRREEGGGRERGKGGERERGKGRKEERKRERGERFYMKIFQLKSSGNRFKTSSQTLYLAKKDNVSAAE